MLRIPFFTLLVFCVSIVGTTATASARDSADASKRLLVLTGGEGVNWRFQLSPEWGEHLIFGPGHLYAARTYYYKGLLGYRERFERYLAHDAAWSVETVDLDDNPPPQNFRDYDVVVLDDVRAAAVQPALDALWRYVEGGGNLLIAAGAHGLGGHEIQKMELPALPLDLLVDPPVEFTFYEPVAWSHFTTVSSFRKTALERVLPVEIISQPDLVVLDRRSHGGGRILPVTRADEPGFVAAVPIEEMGPVGYHKVRAREGAQVLATVGDEGDPLVVSGRHGRGRVIVVTANELEGAVRLNGQPTNASINTPQIHDEVHLWEHTDTFWRAAVHAITEIGSTVSVSLPERVSVGDPIPVVLDAAQAGVKAHARVERMGTDRAFYRFERVFPVEGERFTLPVEEFPEGSYRVVYQGVNEAGKHVLGSAPFTIEPVEGFRLQAPLQFGVMQGEARDFAYEVTTDGSVDAITLRVDIRSTDGSERIDQSTHPLSLNAESPSEARLQLHGNLTAGKYRMRVTAEHEGRTLTRTEQPFRVHEGFETPDLFMMIAGIYPSFPVLEDLATNRAVVTVQMTGQQRFLPFSEYFGGMPRAPHLTDNLPLDDELRWENWKGEKVDGGNGGRFSWALPEVLDVRDENLREWAKSVDHFTVHPFVMFDDEPAMPMNGGWEAASIFEEEFGMEAPVPAASYDDPEYMARWTAWQDFRAGVWANFYERGTKALQSVNPDIRTAVVIEGMGKDLYAGFDPSISQAPLDIYWFHIYPLNEPLTMVGHAVERGKSALRVIGDPMRERYALLQNWAAVGNTPRVPNAGYIENQYWMAIAHGATAVGYWPYAYGWWTTAGTPSWKAMSEISDRQRWLAPVLSELTDVRNPIGLLFSGSQAGLDHLKGLMSETAQESARPWRNYHVTDEAYHTLKQSGLPFEIVDERELMMEGANLPYEALVMGGIEYLRTETMEALAAFSGRGGHIWKDEASTVEVPQARRLPLNFDKMYEQIFPEDPKMFNYFKHRDDFQPLIDENLPIILEHLSAYDNDRVRLSATGVVWNELQGGEATYLFVVNNTANTPDIANFREISREWRLTPVQWHAVTTEVSVAGRKVVVDIENQEVVTTRFEGDRTVWEAEVGPASGLIYAVMDALPERLSLDAPGRVNRGRALEFEAKLHAGRRSVAEVVLPVTATLETPSGTQTRYLSTRDGVASGSFFIGADVPEGARLLLRISQPALGLEVQREVVIDRSPLPLVQL